MAATAADMEDESGLRTYHCAPATVRTCTPGKTDSNSKDAYFYSSTTELQEQYSRGYTLGGDSCIVR